ncbi:MarR family winged helix-turn-helix transcriptional regulator [Specibacter cremeus]|uniref:MarR family winged helix-turn-helix transcriptional regulator n=1 Tax=Specibacter cremeus TaxID=1629051 RepID=UPI000F7B4D8A|nr:MarR family transcriptional regulator [Specibacter cremeus]
MTDMVDEKSTTAGPGPAAPVAKPRGRGSSIGPLAAELRVAIMRTSRRLRTEAAGHALSPGQYSVLNAVSKAPLGIGQLAEREMIQAPSMTRIVNALEADGLVARCDNPADKRQVLVKITDDGAARLIEARSKRTQWLATRIAARSPEDRAILAEAARILQEMSAQ